MFSIFAALQNVTAPPSPTRIQTNDTLNLQFYSIISITDFCLGEISIVYYRLGSQSL